MVQPNPYAKGRWYQIFVESDGNNYTLGDMDLDAVVSASYLILPEDFHLIDVKYDITSALDGTPANLSMINRIIADGRQCIYLPGKALFTSAYIYVFGYFDL